MLYASLADIPNFDDFVKECFKILCDRNPVTASYMGLTQYDEKWPDLSLEGIKNDIQLFGLVINKTSSFSPDSINPGEQEDLGLLKWFMQISLLELDEFEYWKYAPRLVSTLISGILVILRREGNIDVNFSSLVSRLESIMPLIDQVVSRVSAPVKLWVDVEVKSAKGLNQFLETIPNYYVNLDSVSKAMLRSVIQKAKNELEVYHNWLVTLETRPDLPNNKSAYEKLIQARNLRFSPSDIKNMGEDYLLKTQSQLEELVKELRGDSIEEVRDRIRKDHAPDYEKAKEVYEQLAIKAKQFLIEKELVTMPQEKLEVIYTPPPMRNFLSIAAAGTPGRFDEKQTGYFFLTPHEDLSMLEEHSYSYQPLLISHESYPGHHLHGACKNQHSSLIRTRIFANPSPNINFMYSSKLADITEGWGLYCEKLMYDTGFENDLDNPDLRQKFLQINALRWRASRMVIDVKLHSGEISFDEAVSFLMKNTGYKEITAKAEVMMYSLSPGYFLSYLLGRHLILDLKQSQKGKMEDKEFHDRIIYAGNVPFWFIRDVIFSS